ncbi:MAG: 3-keto-disaccharide hydrolase [Gemmataceae bacterium]
MRRVLVVCLLAVSLTVCHAREEKATAFLPEDLSGWEGLVKEFWTVKDGTLVGNSGEKGIKGDNTFLCSTKTYKDFELKFNVKLDRGAGNSGIQFRSKLVEGKKHVVAGPQADIGAGYWGSLYGERFGGMMKAAAKETQKEVKKDDFNAYHIVCVGKKVTIKVNGTTTVDEEFEKLPDEGIIAFQLHAGGPMVVTFKDIQFKDLSK